MKTTNRGAKLERFQTRRTGPFILGLLSAFYIPVFGQLYLAEIVVIVLFVSVLLTRNRFCSKELRLTTLLIILWGFGLMLSSLWNQADISSFVTDFSAVLFLLLSIQFILNLCASESDFRNLFMGVALGYLLACIVQPGIFFSASPWKFGYAVPVTLLAVWIASRLRNFLLRWVVLAVLAAINILGDFRSMALIVVIVLCVDIARLAFQKRLRSRSDRTRFLITVIIIAVSVGTLLSMVYTGLANAGILGASAEVRSRMQGGGSALVMLLGGRNEIFYSIPAALNSPLLGYGPAAEISRQISDQARMSLASIGLSELATQERAEGNLPVHSTIMGAWISAGVLGLAVWIYISQVIIRGFSVVVASLEHKWVLPGFLTLMLLWNMAFSPFGGSARFLTAATIAWSIYSIQRSLPVQSARFIEASAMRRPIR
ncbi:hypothetical protein [Cryobacterium sp. PH31-O1]|uniref:hypothetical protein n=1 Tax=Cryobacterium sp. PH31-O1 TaxID=3046306 RepID=UPI0024BAA851|nr:hypothetical protein [Cryobacterium sp. PH31-O1]MDJ0338361.1 hypothetical protein [Cryobacterium sp. PH31-O1]